MKARKFALLAFALLLSACGGGGGSSPALPGGGNGGGGNTVVASSGAINGIDNTFYPTDGDSSAGGNGQTVDGLTCNPTMDESHYHVHFFLGFIKNGVFSALPDGTGMKDPGADSGGFVSTASCFYDLHTHDASGIVHIESPSTQPLSDSLFTLGQYLDVWGQTLPGGITIYTNGQQFTGTGPQLVSNSSYTPYSGDPRAIPLYGHEVIWVESGSGGPAASALPSIQFTN